ncbi:SMI1/KNR4 family protein [Capnocytophaga stomatis]|uniref:SMI1/KNR4 family protein n=1 Tax=Capnocytophaga stomatis TaxID=1848904 RepID=A0ABW8QBJ4_9FLAO|nr:SMI1/KNR4 family protein [Capnocytophaga stomatis]GIJ96011.1 SMI1/KNR4 family protein [Capnocytophaga stomatis]GIM49029.1 SMI1/KNR4 family protein [Capnocytophaga stomatis]
MGIQIIWQKIREELEKMNPKVGKSFNPPAEEEKIHQLEVVTGQNLPDDFKNYLRTFNGQNHQWYETLFVGYNALLSVDEIISDYEMLFENEEVIDWLNPNKIQPSIWNKGWIPFANFNGSQQIFIDLNPTSKGVYGQIVQLWSGIDMESDEVVIANSFYEFSEKVLQSLQEKSYNLEDDVINVEWFV